MVSHSAVSPLPSSSSVGTGGSDDVPDSAELEIADDDVDMRFALLDDPIIGWNRSC